VGFDSRRLHFHFIDTHTTDSVQNPRKNAVTTLLSGVPWVVLCWRTTTAEPAACVDYQCGPRDDATQQQQSYQAPKESHSTSRAEQCSRGCWRPREMPGESR
jgi:hypothetical protein